MQNLFVIILPSAHPNLSIKLGLKFVEKKYLTDDGNYATINQNL
jgi:hypothetical protein